MASYQNHRADPCGNHGQKPEAHGNHFIWFSQPMQSLSVVKATAKASLILQMRYCRGKAEGNIHVCLRPRKPEKPTRLFRYSILPLAFYSGIFLCLFRSYALSNTKTSML